MNPTLFLMLLVSISAVYSTPLKTGSARASEPPTEWKDKFWAGLEEKKLPRVYFDDKIAVYWSEDIKSSTIPASKRDFLIKTWTQITKTYGQFGNDSRLHVVCHEVDRMVGWYGGSYMQEKFDNKNVISVIFTTDRWSSPSFPDSNFGDIVLAMAEVVVGAYGGVEGDPTERIWKKEYAKIFAYDVFMGMGESRLARSNNDKYTKDSPQWYGKWFSKVWKQNFLKEYFQLLKNFWPKENGANFPKYSRKLTFGEYIHFTSGAVKRDLTDQYKTAFDWDEETEEELNGARSEFPQVRY